MASELHTYGSAAQVTAAINAMGPSNHPGQSTQLSRVQADAIAEVNSFPSNLMFVVDITCHHDNGMSHISIRVAPSRLDKNNNVMSPF